MITSPPRVCAIATLGFLLGCASPHTLTQRTPVLEFTTPLSPREVASRISREWSKELANISTLLDGDGYLISYMHPFAGADATVSIQPSGSGSKVRYFERMPSLTPAWMSAPVKGCNIQAAEKAS
ncbi:MAG: hypothetical protein HXX12_09990 [Geothrix sp.]|uniref:hypothetical protein n=1 Tax=Geothrix sp. TaxID=1962974 RepID=UPI0017E867A8|nr:hypothetical protein [Geothrix sp.]NWJ41289.1 hypothetical protein [Geothrix sp.]WIL20721.1 MAG: hypothetical protein QOZ81_003306 [Geothrix sp.]